MNLISGRMCALILLNRYPWMLCARRTSYMNRTKSEGEPFSRDTILFCSSITCGTRTIKLRTRHLSPLHKREIKIFDIIYFLICFEPSHLFLAVYFRLCHNPVDHDCWLFFYCSVGTSATASTAFASGASSDVGASATVAT